MSDCPSSTFSAQLDSGQLMCSPGYRRRPWGDLVVSTGWRQWGWSMDFLCEISHRLKRVTNVIENIIYTFFYEEKTMTFTFI